MDVSFENLSIGEISKLLLSEKELICPKCEKKEIETKLLLYTPDMEVNFLKIGCINRKCNFEKEWGDSNVHVN